ncbi:hypothetical protein ACWCXH_33800 [Kitasatospora sp. NPDC001660]
MGAHGGAGTTTVARLLDPHAVGRATELAQGQPLPLGSTPVLVARSTSYGLLRAVDVLNRWHASVPRPWLVIVRDAPAPLPGAVRYRSRTLAGRVLGVVTVPYLYGLRSVDDASEALSTRPIAKAGRALRGRLGIAD